MTDIVERLRLVCGPTEWRSGLLHDAADEIERLREEIKSLRADHEATIKHYEKMLNELP